MLELALDCRSLRHDEDATGCLLTLCRVAKSATARDSDRAIASPRRPRNTEVRCHHCWADGLPNWPATDYLLECAIASQSITGDTVRTYGESLTAWIRHLEERGLSLATATERHLKLYRNALTNTNPKLSPFTIRARVLTVLRFYEWGEQTGKLHSSLGRWNATEHAAAAGIAGKSSTLRPLVPRQPVRLPRTLSPQQISNLLAASKLPYRLMYRWAVCTGFAALSSATLRTQTSKTLCAAFRAESNRNSTQRRQINFSLCSSELLDETRWYALTDRPSTLPAPDIDLVFLTKVENQ